MNSKRILTVALLGMASLSLAAAAPAKDPTTQIPGTPVDIQANVINVRVVTPGEPLAGLHLDVKVKGKTLDVYIAPMNFVAKYGVKINKGDDVHVIGAQFGDTVLARNVTTGWFGEKDGQFRERLTTYLRNDAGPLWDEEDKVVPTQEVVKPVY
jgi:hypothetical protein